MLLKLAPLVRAELGWQVDSHVVMSDACLTRGAACYAAVDVDEVSRLIRTSGSWERAIEPPERDFCYPARWKVAARTKWQREGRIDALEGEAFLLALRHAVRDRGRRRRRMLGFVDNQALLGAARKGRSSAPRLLGVCRRIAALALFADIRLHFRFVPSELNVADAPSRGSRGAGCDAWRVLSPALDAASKSECAAALLLRKQRRIDEAERQYQAKLDEIAPGAFPEIELPHFNTAGRRLFDPLWDRLSLVTGCALTGSSGGIMCAHVGQPADEREADTDAQAAIDATSVEACRGVGCWTLEGPIAGTNFELEPEEDEFTPSE